MRENLPNTLRKREYYEGRDFKILPEDLIAGERYRYRESSPGIKRLGVFALEVTTEVVSIEKEDDHHALEVKIFDDNMEAGIIRAKISEAGLTFVDERSSDEGYFLVAMDEFESQFAQEADALNV